MANKLLDRHTRLAKEIEILEAAIAEASKGIDAKEQKFNFQQWKDKWNKSKSASLKKVLNENRIGKGEAVSTGGPVRGILSIGERWRDPKKLLKLLKEREAFLAKNLGQKYARDVDDIHGLTGGGPLRSKLLMRDRANPFYVREFDKQIFWKEKELEVQAQNKFKSQNRGTWQETYDDPYKGWRSLLPETHSNKPGSPNASPNNPLLKTNRDKVTNGDSPTITSVTPKDSLKVGTTYGKDNRYPLTIAGKKTSSIQRELIDAGFTVGELEKLIANNKAWQAARRR